MAEPRLPRGERIYAIGDIHGRFDLFERLIGLIREDNAARRNAHVRIILLGDLIDRGPRSADLILRCKDYSEKSADFIVLKGNHEQAMVEALMGNYAALEAWRRFGGDETLRSWGVPEEVLQDGHLGFLLESAKSAVPREVLRWIEALPLTYDRGSYLFVHAGIRPGIPLSKQLATDLMWIRDDFLNSEIEHSHVVIHGHSISEVEPDVRRNRIGIDTGAYKTGRLAALGLESAEQWTIIAAESGQGREAFRA